MWSDAAREAAIAARKGGGMATEPQTAAEFGQQVSDKNAAGALAQGGAKSVPVAVHSGATGRNPATETGSSEYPW